MLRTSSPGLEGRPWSPARSPTPWRPAEVEVDLGAGHLPLVLAVGLLDQQLGIGVLQRADQGVGGALVEVAFAQGVDVVAVDRADDVLEEAGLLVDPALGRRLGAEQPAAAEEGRSPRSR